MVERSCLCAKASGQLPQQLRCVLGYSACALLCLLLNFLLLDLLLLLHFHRSAESIFRGAFLAIALTPTSLAKSRASNHNAQWVFSVASVSEPFRALLTVSVSLLLCSVVLLALALPLRTARRHAEMKS